MNTQKGFSNLLVLLFIVLIGSGLYLYVEKVSKEITSQEMDLSNPLPVAQDNKQPPTPTPAPKIVEKDILNLDIPPLIKQNRITKTELHLTHSVPYKHSDLCDMKGDSPMLENFTDYLNIISLHEGNLTQIVGQAFPHMLTSDFVDMNGNPKLQEGFIDKLMVSSKEVYKITSGVEGCGQYTYIIPYNNKAVVIKKNFVPPFTGSFTEETVNEFKNIPGVIKPEEAEIIFNNILKQIVDAI